MTVVNKIKEHWFKVKKTENGKHIFEHDQEKQYYQGLLEQIKPNSDYWIAIKQKKPTRTLAQNNYYWLYLNGLENEIGDTAEMLHEDFKERFLPSNEYVYKNGAKRNIYPSTTELSIKEFMEYIRNIEVYTGIQSPDVQLCGLVEYLSRENML